MVPASVIAYVGEWGLPTAAFALLVAFLVAMALQIFLRRKR